MRLLLVSAAVLVLFPATAFAALGSAYNFDFAFGAQGQGPGQFSQPQGIAADPSDGEVFVADTGNNRIQVFGPTGAFRRQWGSLGSAAGQFTNPEGVGVSPLAPFDVYVADTNDNRVEHFANDGTFISSFGTNGSGPGQVEFPRNIAFDDTGNVYVGDSGFNQRVTEWTPSGTFVQTLGGLATFQRLAGLANGSGPNAELYATDSQANTLVGFFPQTPSSGSAFPAGVLNNPQGVTVDSELNGSAAVILVADAGNHRIAAFAGAGPLVSTFGSLGSGEGQFQDPSGLAFSRVNNRLYVAEGNNCCTKVSVWKPIPPPSLGQTMDIEVDKGTVLYKPPGTEKFRKLKKVSLVKSGTVIDARKGTVGITSVTAKGLLQSADFYSGIFKAIQKAQGKGLTDAQLFGGNFDQCPAGLRAAKHVPQTIRRLWGSGAGQFRSRGRFATAGIRGTTWLTDDRCDGTLIRVSEGAVTVRDLVKRKTVVVTAGHQYFARARPRR